jgi:hypothetical protein
MFYETVVTPCPNGFGEYQTGEVNGEGWVSENDLFAEIVHSHPDCLVLELGRDDVPNGLDIQGRIHYQEGRIFVLVPMDGGDVEGPTYLAIVERDE